MTIRVCHIESPLGFLEAQTNDEGLCSLNFCSFTSLLPPSPLCAPASALERQIQQTLQAYFAGDPVDFSRIPHSFLTGTDFQQSVWRMLCTIPHGEVRSYQWMSEALGNPSAMRAVGQANRRNPIPILIPCHRVVTKDMALGGYSGSAERGLVIKRFLLRLEGLNVVENTLTRLPLNG